MVTAPLSFRPAFKDERARASSLFSTVPKSPIVPLQWFLALREEPIERIQGAIWYRIVREGEVAEFSWTATPACSADELPSFFKAWKDELHTLDPAPSHIRLVGWHPEGAVPQKDLNLLGLNERPEERTFHGIDQDTLTTFADAPANNTSTSIRALTSEDLPQVRAWCESKSIFERYELYEGLNTAASDTPSLFDLRTSAGAFSEGKLAGLCLTTYGGTTGRIIALESEGDEDAACQRQLTQTALQQIIPTGHPSSVIFECPISEELSKELKLTNLGKLHRYSAPLTSATTNDG
jgi:hypothetical protein